MKEEKTVYMSGYQKPPKLIALWEGNVHEFFLSGRQSLGRPSKAGHPDLALPVDIVSRKHGEFLTERGCCRYRDLNSSNGTFRNGKRLAAETFQELLDGDVLRIHGKEDEENVLDVLLVYSTAYPESTEWERLPLNEEIAEIGVGREDQIALRDASVSRRHASFFRASGGWAVIDHGSLNGVYVNHKRINQPVYLSRMDTVRISGYLFFFLGDFLLYQTDWPVSSENELEAKLSICIEERNVWQRMKKKTLLKDIRMEIPSGSMVLILGGSGAGKTTFMNAVMGYEPAEGMIRYKNTDIYEEYETMKYEIGYVPQQDLLRMNDTVYATLLNAAKMKLPARLTEEELDRRVRETMDILGLEREQGSQVGKLSGGQRKRLSIAVEYVGNPSLFFLDEPDSGLDGTMARALMGNLRSIADEGKIVIVISHSPDRAFALFDQVIVLAKSSRDDTGHLVFYGPPKSACDFFEVDCLEGIVARINRPDEGGDGLADYYIERYASRKEAD